MVKEGQGGLWLKLQRGCGIDDGIAPAGALYAAGCAALGLRASGLGRGTSLCSRRTSGAAPGMVL